MNDYIDLSIKDICLNCFNNEEDFNIFINNMLYIKDDFNNRIHRITNYSPYSIYHFMHKLRASLDMDNMISNIRLSSDDLIDSICDLLEIDNSLLSEEESIELINSNISTLKSFKDKSINDKYPKYYDMFQEGLGMYHRWKNIDFLDPSNPEEKELYDALKKIKDEYFSYGFRYSYDKYTDVQAEFLERLIRHKEEIKNYCENKSINDIYFKSIDKDKFNLYLFFKYIEKIKNSEDDKLKFRMLDILRNNLYKIINIDDKVTVMNGINKTFLMAEYTILNRKYGIPKVVSVDGAILPSSEDKNKKGTGRERTYKPLSDEERAELIKINREKKDFYNNSGYLTVINEKEDLTGYSAFVYPNGHILEDYIADELSDASLKKNKKNAVYHVDIYGFEDLLDMVKDGKGKLEVKRDSRCHGSFNHTGDWVNKLEKVVKIEGNDEVFEDTKQFIKRINNKKSK